MSSLKASAAFAAAAITTGASALAVGVALPAHAGLVSSFSAYETLSAFPTAGAQLDTRLSSAPGAIPLSWTTALVMGNGGWELGLNSVVVSPFPAAIAKFDTLAPWGRAKLPSLWGVPLVFIAGATIPASTGSSTVAGIGLGASFDWDGDRVDVNVGTRLNPGNPGALAQAALHVLFTHPLGKDFLGNAEIVFHGGTPGTDNVMIERLGFTRTWSDNWASDLSVTLNTPLAGTASLTVAPSLGLTYTF